MECEYEKRKKCDSLYIEKYNRLLKENEELKSIINKAIEYIEGRLYVDKETGEYWLAHTFDGCNLYELLKILDKGEQNE